MPSDVSHPESHGGSLNERFRVTHLNLHDGHLLFVLLPRPFTGVSALAVFGPAFMPG
jgi:hypothetical protein